MKDPLTSIVENTPEIVYKLVTSTTNSTSNTTASSSGHSATSIYEGGSPIAGDPLSLFLVQLMIVVLLCKILAFAFKFIKQPPVIAEVVSGILLGPSAFGRIPKFTDTIFPTSSLPIFNVFANWGLILFMFMVGLEINTKIMKRNATSALGISIAGIICPFLLGCGSSYVIFHKVANDGVSYSAFLLFVAVAMSITAFPVLARILTEIKILHTKVGTLALSAAAVDDVVSWCILALVVAYAKAVKLIDALWTFLCLIGFILIMFVLVRPLIASFAVRRQSSQSTKYTMVMVLLFCVFLCSWITQIIGVHAIFGSFILGIVVPRKNKFAHSILERIEDLVVVILLPLYFTYSGLRTNIGSLKDGTSWGLVILIITTACLGKIIGATIASKIVKCSWRESVAVGILMNTKGLVELIVLNVGLDVKVLNTEIFTMFVIMALVTTFITTPLIHFAYVRYLPKETEVVSQDTFSVVLASQNKQTAPWMVTAASLFVNVKEQFAMKTLFLSEISDRPSSYFLSEFYSAFQDSSILGGKERKGVLLKMHTQANKYGIEPTKLQTRSLASSDVAADLVDYTHTHDVALVMFDIHHSIENPTSPGMLKKSSGFNLRTSMSVLNNPVNKMFSFRQSEALLRTALHKIVCSIGVLIHKTNQPLDVVDNIIVIHTGDTYEETTLDFVSTIKDPIKITILTIDADYVKNRIVSRTNVNIVQVKDPYSIEHLDEEKVDYNLIIMGASREVDWKGYHSDSVVLSKIPVLLLFSPKGDQLKEIHVDVEAKNGSSGSSGDAISPKNKSESKGKYTFSEEEMTDK